MGTGCMHIVCTLDIKYIGVTSIHILLFIPESSHIFSESDSETEQMVYRFLRHIGQTHNSYTGKYGESIRVMSTSIIYVQQVISVLLPGFLLGLCPGRAEI